MSVDRFLQRVMDLRLSEQMEAARKEEAKQCPDCLRKFRNLRKERCGPCQGKLDGLGCTETPGPSRSFAC